MNPRPAISQIQVHYELLLVLLQHHYPSISTLVSLNTFQAITDRLNRTEMIKLDQGFVKLSQDRIIQDYLRLVGCLVNSTLDTFWLTTTSLSILPNLKSVPTDQFVDVVSKTIDQSQSSGHIQHPESIAPFKITQCLSSLASLNVINFDPSLTSLKPVITINPNLDVKDLTNLRNLLNSIFQTQLPFHRSGPEAQTDVYSQVIYQLSMILEAFRTCNLLVDEFVLYDTNKNYNSPSANIDLNNQLNQGFDSLHPQSVVNLTLAANGGFKQENSSDLVSDRVIKNWKTLCKSIVKNSDIIINPKFQLFQNIPFTAKKQSHVEHTTNIISNL